VSVATWFCEITFATAATALSGATAAAQSDLRPSGAVTATMGIASARTPCSSFCPRLVCFLAFTSDLINVIEWFGLKQALPEQSAQNVTLEPRRRVLLRHLIFESYVWVPKT
jgi:hypothetical protein